MSLSYQDRFAEDNVVEDVIAEEIENIWKHVSRSISDKWLSTLDIPLSAEIAMLKMRKIVAWATFEHDGVIPAPIEGDDGEFIFDKLTPDGEPAPITIDPWARGTVQTRKVANNDIYRRDDEKGGSGSPRPPSVSSFRSSNTGTGKSSRKTASVAGSRMGSSQGPNSAQQDPTGQIIELGDDDDDYAHLESQLLSTLRGNKKAPAAVAVLSNLPKGEFDEIEETMLKAKKDFKGKKFILDSAGKPLLLAPIKPEALPPYAIPLGLNITNGTAADLNRQRSASHGPGSHSSSSSDAAATTKRKKKTIRVAGSREVDESQFKASYSLASTLAGTENIPVVNPGVVVKSISGPPKEGPALPEDNRRMSRKTYFNRQSSSSQLGMNMSRADTFGSLGTAGDQSLAIGFAEDDNSLLPASMVQFQDIDAFEGSRRVVPLEQGDDLGDRDDIGVKTTSGHVELGVLPSKPSWQQMQNVMQLTGGAGLLRDRDLPQNMKSPNERRHLPAPPVGQVSGHGLTSPGNIPVEKQGSTFQNSIASNDNRSLSKQQTKSVTSKASQGTIKSERKDIIRQLF